MIALEDHRKELDENLPRTYKLEDWCGCLRPGPATGLSLSSHSDTPSQAQMVLGFSNTPADLAIMPQANLKFKN